MKIKVETPTEQYLQDRKVRSWKIWQKKVKEDKRKVTKFEWCHYEAEEYYLLEGKVVVDTQDGKIDLVAGDFVIFPAQLSCVWTIKESVKLHYHHHFPKEYGPHPNPHLQKMFREKPWQGQKPEEADIIFLALDANYSPCVDIELIRPYHTVGVEFWENNKQEHHHPFLTDQYTGSDGKKFHETFAMMGLDSSFAKYISFVELLDYPTVGSRSDANVTYNLKHLQLIDRIIRKAKITFILSSPTNPSGVYHEMLRIKRNYHDIFKWVPDSLKDAARVPPLLYENEFSRIYKPYHFSCSGEQYTELVTRQLPEMKKIIESCVKPKK